VASEAGEGNGFFGQLRRLFEEKSLKFTLGVVSLVIAVLKILGPIQGDVPVIGDLLPALGGLASGTILLFDFFRASSSIQSSTVEKLQGVILDYRKAAGLATAAAGLLHFIVPSVPIL
jgi:hypothetical protein